MSTTKKQVFVRRLSIIGGAREHTLEEKTEKIIKSVQDLFLSRAFDQLFQYRKRGMTIIEVKNKKVDKNLFDYLIKQNEASVSDLRSRSRNVRVKNQSIYSRNTRSRSRVGNRRRIPRSPVSAIGLRRKNTGLNRDLSRSQNLASKTKSHTEIPLNGKQFFS